MNDHSREESAGASNRSLPSVKAQAWTVKPEDARTSVQVAARLLVMIGHSKTTDVITLLDAFAREVAQEHESKAIDLLRDALGYLEWDSDYAKDIQEYLKSVSVQPQGDEAQP